MHGVGKVLLLMLLLLLLLIVLVVVVVVVVAVEKGGFLYVEATSILRMNLFRQLKMSHRDRIPHHSHWLFHLVKV